MAKKEKKAYAGDPGDEHVEKVVTPVMETPKPKIKVEPKKTTWEVKDRRYVLNSGLSPLTYTLASQGLFFFDERVGYERDIKYCENQKTVFVDEMQGQHRMSHITFRNGILVVPREKRILQEFLSLYHPKRDKLYKEIKPKQIANNEIEIMEAEIDALVLAKNLDIDMVEAIMRTEIGSEVAKMSSKELKRDLLVFARNNPMLFMDLANDDNVTLRNIGIRSVEEGILRLSSDNRTFTWASNDRKLMNVPFDEHPYSALAAWFKTDEGMEIFNSVEKRLK
tara:strand:- start:253 stop:1092 length:840 start_codon:yes stop_codon:yes gene_type:complete